MEKVIELNLGIGLNMLFPEPVKIVIHSDNEENTIENNEEELPKD